MDPRKTHFYTEITDKIIIANPLQYRIRTFDRTQLTETHLAESTWPNGHLPEWPPYRMTGSPKGHFTESILPNGHFTENNFNDLPPN